MHVRLCESRDCDSPGLMKHYDVSPWPGPIRPTSAQLLCLCKHVPNHVEFAQLTCVVTKEMLLMRVRVCCV